MQLPTAAFGPSRRLLRCSGAAGIGGNEPLVRADDPEGWPVSEYEEAWELQLGLAHFAERILRSLVHLTHGETAHELIRRTIQTDAARIPCAPHLLSCR